MRYLTLLRGALIPLSGYGLFVLGLLLFISRSGIHGYAGPVDVTYLPALDVQALEARFESVGYTWPPTRPVVPRLVLRGMPPDIERIDDSPTRKALFIRTALPIVMVENERLRLLRSEVTRVLADGVPPPGTAQRAWLERLADRYRVAGSLDHPRPREVLMRRIDTVPRALALAQAAIESGWGTSRFVREGNALFGQWTWGGHPGLTPRSRASGATHRVRRFADLRASVRAYLRQLNTGGVYARFRLQRAALRDADRALDSFTLAETLTQYSERGSAYVADVKTVMKDNGLQRTSSLRLCELRCEPAKDRIEELGARN